MIDAWDGRGSLVQGGCLSGCDLGTLNGASLNVSPALFSHQADHRPRKGREDGFGADVL